MFKNKTILITGGTGSFGQTCSKFLLEKYKLKKLIIFSRDENKQYLMAQKFKQHNIRFFIGDVRDAERVNIAMRDVDFVIHAAALKHVPIAEYNPIECIKTNIYGAENIINAAINCKVKKVIALSTDKATNPINLYGASKLAAEKLFTAANSLSGKQNTNFSVVRYGNVINSRGSVIPFFKKLIAEKSKFLPITHYDMTRFFLSLEDSVKFVLNCFSTMQKGEVFIPKMSSLKISDLASVLNPKAKLKLVGIRPGEKIDEVLCSKEENHYLLDFKDFYVIFKNKQQMLNYNKRFKNKGKRVPKSFFYSSLNNPDLLKINKIKTKFKNFF
jgi:UDP-N-acetylglucosamine 4,6-dehydratase/5-epimerase